MNIRAVKQQKEQETIQWISSAHPEDAQGAPTSAVTWTPQSPRRLALIARLMQPVPEQVASVSLPRGALLHGPPLHLMAKCITHPHPKVKRERLHKDIQPGHQFESTWKGLSFTMGVQQGAL